MKKKIISEEFESDNTKKEDSFGRQTKKKTDAQKILPILIVIIVSLVVILTCVLIAYYQVYKSEKQNSNILEAVYASSYYSMVDSVNNLSVDLSKFTNLSTNDAKYTKLVDMRKDCAYIIAGLSTLPISQSYVVPITKFFNQIDGLCQSYSNKLSKNENLTASEELLIIEIRQVVEDIKSNLNRQNFGMYDSNFNFVEAGIFDNAGMNELSSTLGDVDSSEIDYPAIIFDGPFSSALETKQVKGLGENEITTEQAHNYLKNVVFSGQSLKKIDFLQENEGEIPTFDFFVEAETYKLNAQVSKKGCLLISISGYAEPGDSIMGVEQASEMAKTFANNIGFENMEVVWHEKNENVVYINLVSVQNGCLLYPDMVKVKLDLTSQTIVGFEAQNYAFNHCVRNLSFTTSESEAEGELGFDYNILKTSKSLIKLDSGKEVCAYEFIVERIDGDYFYYIDANTNKIVKILKLVKVKDVEKLI